MNLERFSAMVQSATTQYESDLSAEGLDVPEMSVADIQQQIYGRQFDAGLLLWMAEAVDSLPSATPAQRMVKRTALAIFAMECAGRGEQTACCLDIKRNRGEKLGGRVPYGYRVIDIPGEPKRLAEDDAEQVVIGLIQHHRANGRSLDQIADSLNESGSTTRGGGPWRRQYIHRILKGGAK